MSTTQRPEFTIAEVVDRFDVSRSTIRRGLAEDRFPSARKDAQGRWVIRVDDLLQAGYKARKTWLAQGAHEGAHDPGSQGAHELAQGVHTPTLPNESAVLTEQAQLCSDLAHERAQVEKLTALLESERAHVASLKMAMRMLEAGPTPEPAKPTPEPPAKRRWWNLSTTRE